MQVEQLQQVEAQAHAAINSVETQAQGYVQNVYSQVRIEAVTFREQAVEAIQSEANAALAARNEEVRLREVYGAAFARETEASHRLQNEARRTFHEADQQYRAVTLEVRQEAAVASALRAQLIQSEQYADRFRSEVQHSQGAVFEAAAERQLASQAYAQDVGELSRLLAEREAQQLQLVADGRFLRQRLEKAEQDVWKESEESERTREESRRLEASIARRDQTFREEVSSALELAKSIESANRMGDALRAQEAEQAVIAIRHIERVEAETLR